MSRVYERYVVVAEGQDPDQCAPLTEAQARAGLDLMLRDPQRWPRPRIYLSTVTVTPWAPLPQHEGAATR